MSQTTISTLMGIVVAASLSLSGWALAKINEFEGISAKQAAAALALKEGTESLTHSVRDNSQRIGRNEINDARMSEQINSLMRELARLEGRE